MSDKSPDAFRTISEVADWLGVQPHVLRFWESKFSQVRPVKRAGGRRYYRPNDMLLLGGIRKLLHEDGLTIKGAQKVLREEGISHVSRLSQPLDAESAAFSDMAAAADEDLPAPPANGPNDALDIEEDPSQPEAIPAEPQPASRGGPTSPPTPDPTSRPGPAEAPKPSADLEDAGQTPEHPQVSPGPAPAQQPAHESGKESAPLPSFARKPRPSAEPEPASADPVSDDRLPSFLRRPQPADRTPSTVRETAGRANQEVEAELPLEFPDTAAEPEPHVEERPKPRIVDAPDPDESAFQVTSGALSAAFSRTSISADRRAELLPLAAQLAALRDRMAAGRGR